MLQVDCITIEGEIMYLFVFCFLVCLFFLHLILCIFYLFSHLSYILPFLWKSAELSCHFACKVLYKIHVNETMFLYTIAPIFGP